MLNVSLHSKEHEHLNEQSASIDASQDILGVVLISLFHTKVEKLESTPVTLGI